MTNSNCLQGLRCPECGAYEPFRIEVKTLITFYDAGQDHDNAPASMHWSDDSWCHCYDCEFVGTVADLKRGHTLWSAIVMCTFCELEIPADTAHRHHGSWIGECCWDERLKASE